MDYNKVRKAKRRNKFTAVKLAAVIATAAVLILIVALIIYLVRPGSNTQNEIPEQGNTIALSETASPSPIPEETLTPTAAPPTEAPVVRRGTAEPIPDEIREQMYGVSMPEGASISFDELSYLTIPHYDFDFNVTEGHMVVNAQVAEEVLDIFAELFDIQYPIQRMELIDKYGGDDYASIDDNNTSAFNYRLSTDGTGRLSKHALGRAIDINPQINPYVDSDGTGAHSNAEQFWSRDTSLWTSEIGKKAYIGPDSEIYRIFTEEHGWEWGGSWSSYRDYQHFQKTE